MSEWKEFKLGDLTNMITKGTTPSSLGGGFVDKGVNYIKSEAVGYDGRIDKSTFVYIDEAMHQKLKRSQLAKDDILFSMAGIFLGKNALVPEDVLPANTNQALAIIRLNQQKANPKFIHYYLRQRSVIELVNNMSGQSAQPNINFEEIKSIDILLPELKEQIQIASILSSIDDKIDLLHRQNKTLEQLAETLFRQWFVEEAEENTVKLGDSVKTSSGGTPSRSKMEYYTNGRIKWVKSKELQGSYIFETEEMVTDDAVKNSSAKLFPANTILIAMYGATVGEFGILAEPATCNQAICALIPNENYPYTFLFTLTKYNKENLINMAGGSAQQNISQELIQELVIPKSNERIKEFHLYVDPMFQKIKSNTNQIRTLTQLRDTLLPRLMIGEVRVK